jgi:transposase
MGAAIALRDDFDGDVLRGLARRSRDGGQSRRLLALAAIYDGKRRSDAAQLAGVGLQIVRDWVLRFNAEGPAGLIDRKAPGPARRLTDEQRAALAKIVDAGPVPAIHGVVRWRRRDLAQWLWDEFGVSLDDTTVGRELRRMGFAKLSARPRHHAQNEYAVDDFKKTSRSG